MKIITNNQPRNMIYWHDLTPKEREQFDHYRNADDGAEYVRYRGCVYDLCDIMKAPDSMSSWDAAAPDSYFSGFLVRFVDDGERVICGRWFE